MAISPQIAQALKVLQTEHSGIFQSAFDEANKEFQPLISVMPNNTSNGTYGWMASLPSMRKWVGDAVFHALASRAYVLPNEPYELSYQIQIDALEDNINTLDTFAMHPAMAGESAGRLEEELAAAALLGNTLTCFDGLKFFATTHPVNIDDASKGVYSNLFTASPLNAANFEAAYSRFRLQKGDNGVALRTKATHIIVGPDLELTADRLLKARMTSGGGSDNASVENINYNRVQIIVAPYLGDSKDWYLADLSKSIKPLLWQDRKNEGLTSNINDITERQQVRDVKFQIFRRGALGCTLPFLMHKLLA